MNCHAWMEKNLKAGKAFLTTSGTHALELASLVSGVQPGDEIILPSFTFSSTANAFILRGAKIVFVDIRPDTMNIDEALIEEAIGPATRGIVPVHYGGVSCEMDRINALARENNLWVFEDAAQAFFSTYKGKYLGTLGDFGAFSFHETKNFTSGEGGALLIRDPGLFEKAEVAREKGTNRSQYFRGEVDKYTWRDVGSSYLPSDLNAAVLFAQLEIAREITENRLKIWNSYYEFFKPLQEKNRVTLPGVPPNCRHNAHMFYLKVAGLEERYRLIRFLGENQILATFHYIPLHTTTAGKRFGTFCGEERFTVRESERLVRLPLFYGMSEPEVLRVCGKVEEFFNKCT